MRNFEADRWLTVGEAMREVEKLTERGHYHTIDLGEAGFHDVDCDDTLNIEDLQIAFLGVSRDRAE